MESGLNTAPGHSTRLAAVAWVAIWLVSLAGLLAYIYVSERTTLWVWVALLLLALVSPTPSAYRRVLGHRPS